MKTPACAALAVVAAARSASSSITGMVQKLQAAGLLDRHPEPGNARATLVELTDAGQALIPQVKRVWIQLARDTVAAVPAADLAQLRVSLTALVQSLQSARP